MERNVKYIQLPPLPEDIEMPALEAIWLIARMNPEQRKDALKQIEAIAGIENDGKADYEAVEAILNKYEDVGEDDLFSLKILKDIKYCTYVIRMIKLK